MIGLEVRDAEGLVIDTIPPPLMVDGEQASRFAIHPFGALVVGSPDVYGFEIRNPDGTVVKVKMPFHPVRFTEAELARLSAAMRPIVAADGGQEPDIPENGWPVVFSHTHVYVVETGEYDEQYLVRYRLQISDTVRKRN